MARPLVAFLMLLVPRVAFAHGGNPAQAVVLTPDEIGPPVSDAFLIEWLDAGPPPPPTGSATIALHYTPHLPYPHPLGITPPDLTGTEIMSQKEELEPNQFSWDVSNVPSGHYWIWSRVTDPPEEMSAQYIRFSPAPLTVLHPGDDIGPAIALIKPQSEFASADAFYTIDFHTYDSTGTARIRFEASPDAFRSEPMWFVIADNIPAQPRGTIGWNTSVLEQGDYMLRATITDCRGRSFVAHSRYFLFVAHLDPVDAGVNEAGPPPDGGSLEEWCNALPEDSGVVPIDAGASDAGTAPEDAGSLLPPGDEGCGCESAGRREPFGSIAICFMLFVLVLRARRTSPCMRSMHAGPCRQERSRDRRVERSGSSDRARIRS